jgi:hypothetical protein
VRTAAIYADPVWSTYGLACDTLPGGACPQGNKACLPAVPDAGGAGAWHACVVLREAIDPCTNTGPYTDRHLLYDGATMPACSPCACGASTSTCTASLALYEDSACITFVGALALGDAPVCTESQSTVQSALLGPVTYTPGACAPGGGVESGTVTPTGPSTFCCIPQ